MTIKCNLCSFTAPYNSGIRKHERAVHLNLRPWPCPFPGCDHRAKRKSHLERHRRGHEVDLEARCPYICQFENCGSRLSDKSTLTRHVKTVHQGRDRMKEKIFQCEFCNFKTQYKAHLSQHVKTQHKKLATFTCPYPGCDFATSYSSSFHEHKSRHCRKTKVVRPFPCRFPNCEYRGRSGYFLKRHIRNRHDTNLCTNVNQKKDLQCPMCPKICYSQTGLNYHITGVHANEKAYSCDICSYSTACQRQLKLHCQRKHEKGHVDTRFKCDLCALCAYSKGELEIHKRTAHTEEREFQCSYPGCGYRTNYAHIFRSHVLIHEEDPQKRYPFACTFPGCDFRRRLRTEIKAHERKHRTSKSQLKCDSCPERAYPDLNSLDFHDRMTHNQRSYSCPKCHYVSNQKRNLRNHVCTPQDADDVGAKATTKSQSQPKASGHERVTDGLNAKNLFACSNCNFQAYDKRLLMKHLVCHEVAVILLHKVCIKVV